MHTITLIRIKVELMHVFIWLCSLGSSSRVKIGHNDEPRHEYLILLLLHFRYPYSMSLHSSFLCVCNSSFSVIISSSFSNFKNTLMKRCTPSLACFWPSSRNHPVIGCFIFRFKVRVCWCPLLLGLILVMPYKHAMYVAVTHGGKAIGSDAPSLPLLGGPSVPSVSSKTSYDLAALPAPQESTGLPSLTRSRGYVDDGTGSERRKKHPGRVGVLAFNNLCLRKPSCFKMLCWVYCWSRGF